MDGDLIFAIMRMAALIGLCYIFYNEGYERGYDKGWKDYREWFYGNDEKEKKKNEH